MKHSVPLPTRARLSTKGLHRPVAFFCLLAVLLPVCLAAVSDGEVDLDMVYRIRDEGFNRSQVMEVLEELCDGIGPRLTGSPQMNQANRWTRDKLAEWGLENSRLESFGPFGLGWSYERVAVHMLAPHKVSLLAVPRAWTPGTDGPVRGSVMAVAIESVEDFEKYRGKLAGKILLLGKPRELEPRESPRLRRHSEDDLTELAQFPIPSGRRRRGGDYVARRLKRWRFGKELRPFLLEEKVVALVQNSYRDAGVLVGGGGGSRQQDEEPGPPGLVVSAEDFNRLHRLLKRKVEVELEVEVVARFHDQDLMAYNTVAEIPGRGPDPEVVMLGGHLDSWHTGTGATDNAAGVAVAMEAVRILSALGVEPKRSIRIGLWSGEEQGLLGSRAYVREHLAARLESEDDKQQELPAYMRRPTGPLTFKPAYEQFSAYFNLDNGSGKIRGIYLQENAAAAPLFEAWLRPFADLGANTVTLRNTHGTDHLAFDSVGLPGFQFIQDAVEYNTLTHHTNMDVFDRLQREDLIQASVIMASFVYHAAMTETKIPRKPLPKETEGDSQSTARPTR